MIEKLGSMGQDFGNNRFGDKQNDDSTQLERRAGYYGAVANSRLDGQSGPTLEF